VASTACHIAFQISPRINAVGRLSHAGQVVELLLTEDANCAIQLAEHMNSMNRFKQSLQGTAFADAIMQINAHPEWLEQRTLLVSGEYHEGVVGIVAGKIAERFYKPTLCISVDGDKAKGSGRAGVPDFDLYNTLQYAHDISGVLSRYGGHSAAAGFSLQSSDIETLREVFHSSADMLWTDDTPESHFMCDAPLELSHLSFKLVDDLKLLEPFGTENPMPVFFVKSALVDGATIMGQDDKHLRAHVRDSAGRMYPLVAFGKGREIEQWQEGTYRHLLVNVQENIWQNQRSIQMHLVDSRPA
jgi:single-stranded-DNA-specific exonuclease